MMLNHRLFVFIWWYINFSGELQKYLKYVNIIKYAIFQQKTIIDCDYNKQMGILGSLI